MRIIKFLLPFYKLEFGFLGEIIGGLISGGASLLGANKSANTAEANTNKQLAWERERATNAHQWEVQDLEKAGLNPILSAGGSGATTGGITPQMPDTSGYDKAGESIAIAVQNAIQNKQRQQEINSSVALNEAKAKEAEANADLMNKRLDEIEASIGNLSAQSTLYGKQATTAEKQALHYEQLIRESKEAVKKITQQIENLIAEKKAIDTQVDMMPDKKKKIQLSNISQKIQNEIKEKQNKVFWIDKGFEWAGKLTGAVATGTGAFYMSGATNAVKTALKTEKGLKILEKVKNKTLNSGYYPGEF